MAGEWVEWAGGECPLAVGARFDVRYRDGMELCGDTVRDKPRLNAMLWEHNGGCDDFITYREVYP